MTFMILCQCHFSVHFEFFSMMNKKLQTTPKEGVPTPVRDIPVGKASWSRCNSFSSSSNDSAIFCSDHGLKNSNSALGKRLLTDISPAPMHKRSRNSSGSSASSSMSYASEDVNKSTIIIHPAPTVPPDIESSVKTLTRVSCSQLSPKNNNLSHKTLFNGQLSSDNSSSFRHNLRRNIRKKTCSCDCTATCTTVFVRRYNKIGKKTVEQETVFSSTKVQTCSQENSTQKVHKISYDKSFSPNKPNNRRRKSEVEKLYDSLHEIEWAKNISPDNILQQLNVRQAATLSIFGNTSKHSTSNKFSEKSPKSSCNLTNKESYTETQTEHSFQMKSCKLDGFKMASSTKHIVNANDTCKRRLSAEIGETVLTEPDISFQYKNENCKLHCSSSHLLVEKEKNDSFLLEDNQNIALNPVKVVSNIKKEIPNDSSEFSMNSYFDIADDNICTIDACFREVGAEVIISSGCNDYELPQLTSMADNVSEQKNLQINDSPPILEPCINIDKFDNQCIKKSDKISIEDSGKTINSEIQNTESICAINSVNKNLNESTKCFTIIKEIFKSSVKPEMNFLIITAGRKILKKYLKFLRSRQHLKPCDKLINKDGLQERSNILEKVDNTVNVKLVNDFSKRRNIFKSLGSTKKHSRKSDQFYRHETSTVFSKMISGKNKSKKFGCNIIDKTNSGLDYSDKKYSSINPFISNVFPHQAVFNQIKKANLAYISTMESSDTKITYYDSYKRISDTFEDFTFDTSIMPQKYKTVFMDGNYSESVQPSCSTIKTLLEIAEEKHKPSVVEQCLLTVCYDAINVFLGEDYVQVAFKLTHGSCSYLSLEGLKELKDVVHRCGKEERYRTLILNGTKTCFCMGLDLLPLIGPLNIKFSNAMAVAIKDLVLELSHFKKPVVAFVNGPAHGLGMTLLTYADVSIASSNATFCMPQSSLGYFPEGGATLTLPEVIGSTMAMDLILRGRTITAHEATKIGLISEVHPANDLPCNLVSRLKILKKNSLSAMETTKALTKMSINSKLIMALENETKLLPQMWMSKSCQDAIKNSLTSQLKENI